MLIVYLWIHKALSRVGGGFKALSWFTLYVKIPWRHNCELWPTKEGRFKICITKKIQQREREKGRNLCRNKGQPADTVVRSTSLHLQTPNDHLEVLTDMRERY